MLGTVIRCLFLGVVLAGLSLLIEWDYSMRGSALGWPLAMVHPSYDDSEDSLAAIPLGNGKIHDEIDILLVISNICIWAVVAWAALRIKRLYQK